MVEVNARNFPNHLKRIIFLVVTGIRCHSKSGNIYAKSVVLRQYATFRASDALLDRSLKKILAYWIIEASK